MSLRPGAFFAVFFSLAVLVPTASAAPIVVINEMMYHPASDDETEEFLELTNVGDATADLSGWFMSDGIDYVFPAGTTLAPGTFLVLSPDLAKFAQTYGTSVTPLGPYTGKLNNGGERVAISNAQGAVMDEVDYLDQAPWPDFADGLGPSLELIDSASDNARPDSWQSSSPDGGTPGAPNSSGAVEPPFVDVWDRSDIPEFEIVFQESNWFEILEANQWDKSFYLNASYRFNGFTWTGVGVRFKGFSSNILFEGEKKPFKVDFNRFNDNQSFMGMTGLKLSNSWNDPTMMREILMADAAREMGLPVGRYWYAFLTVNGEPWGLYVMQDDYNDDVMELIFGDGGGNLFEAEVPGEAVLSYVGPEQAPYETLYSLKENKDENDYSRLIALCDALSNTTDSLLLERVSPLMNVDTTLGYLAINAVFGNLDSYIGQAKNYYLYEDPTDHYRMNLVLWDMNLAFGVQGIVYTGNQMLRLSPYLTDEIAPPGAPGRPLARLFARKEGDRAAYNAWLQAIIDGPFREEVMTSRIAALDTMIAPYVQADPKKLFSFEEYKKNQTEDLENSPYFDEFLEYRIHGLLPWVRGRRAYLQELLATQPEKDPVVQRWHGDRQAWERPTKPYQSWWISDR